MSKYEDPTQLDYRYGGDTVDDFAQKYMKTVAYIFSALNELRSPTGGTLTQNPEAYQLKVDDNKLYIRNQANTDWILLGDVKENFGFRTSASDAFMHESDVADSGEAGKLIRADASGKLNVDILGNAAKIADKAIQMGLDLADEDRLVYDKDTDTITNRPLQFKVDGDKIYARKDATTNWVLLGDLKQNLGFRSSTDDAFLTESDVADSGEAGKLIRADANGKLNADILGNARKMAGKTFAPEDLQDGQIPVYRASDGTWHAENKGTVGTGKNLMIMDGDKMLGEYNGDEMKAIDIQKSSLTKALAESTGYGIVSGCEPSINGLTVTISAGVIHTVDGRRIEVPEQSITLDAADAKNPRTDVVYLDKSGNLHKKTEALSTWYPSSTAEYILVAVINVAADATSGKLADVRSKKPSHMYITDVKAFGAFGDGVHDDTTAFEKAVDYCRNAFNNSLFHVPTVIVIPAGRYIISRTIKLSRFVSLKSSGLVLIQSKVEHGATFSWKNYIDGDIDYRKEFYTLYRYRGYLMDGSNGGIHIVHIPYTGRNLDLDEDKKSIGIEFGNVSSEGNENVDFQTSCFSVNHVGVSGFDIGLKLNNLHVYIIGFENIHAEGNGINIQFGDKQYHTAVDSGENVSFYNCIIAAAKEGVRYNIDGFNSNFYGCSFDFNDIDFHDVSNGYKNVSIFGGHMEGNGAIYVTDSSDHYLENSISLLLSGVTTLKNKMPIFKGKFRVALSHVHFDYTAKENIETMADDSVLITSRGISMQGNPAGPGTSFINNLVGNLSWDNVNIPQAGKRSYTIDQNFADGDTVSFYGLTIYASTDTQDAEHFVVGADSNSSAANLALTLNTNTTVSDIYSVLAKNNTITITEKEAGGGNTPGDMITTNTGKISATKAITSKEDDIEIEGELSWGYRHINRNELPFSYETMLVPQAVHLYVTKNIPSGSNYSKVLKAENTSDDMKVMEIITARMPCTPGESLYHNTTYCSHSTNVIPALVYEFYDANGKFIKQKQPYFNNDISEKWIASSTYGVIVPPGATSFAVHAYIRVYSVLYIGNILIERN